MTRALLVLANDDIRDKAVRWIRGVPKDTRVTFQEPKRTIPQNDRMWAMLGEVAKMVPWHGVMLSDEDWKLLFLDALHREVRIAPNLDGTGFVTLGRSTSNLSKSEMMDLITLMTCFGESHGVVFHGEKDGDIENEEGT
jgi:hypothetical protein